MATLLGAGQRRSAAPATLVILLLLLAGSMPVSSASPLAVRLDRAYFAPGQLVNVSVGGAIVGGLVLLEVATENGTTVHLDASPADAQGWAYFQFRMPPTAPAGVNWTAYASSPGSSGSAPIPIALPPTPVILPPPPTPAAPLCGPFETGAPPDCVFATSSASLSPSSIRAGGTANLSVQFANPGTSKVGALLVVQILEPDGVAPPPQVTSLSAPARSAVRASLPVLMPFDAPAGTATVQVQLLSDLPSRGGEAFYFTTLTVEVLP